MIAISPRVSSVGAAAPAAGVERILEVGLGFWPSKVLLTAVELGVFSILGDKSMTGQELGAALRLDAVRCRWCDRIVVHARRAASSAHLLPELRSTCGRADRAALDLS